MQIDDDDKDEDWNSIIDVQVSFQLVMIAMLLMISMSLMMAMMRMMKTGANLQRYKFHALYDDTYDNLDDDYDYDYNDDVDEDWSRVTHV